MSRTTETTLKFRLNTRFAFGESCSHKNMSQSVATWAFPHRPCANPFSDSSPKTCSAVHRELVHTAESSTRCSWASQVEASACCLRSHRNTFPRWALTRNLNPWNTPSFLSVSLWQREASANSQHVEKDIHNITWKYSHYPFFFFFFYIYLFSFIFTTESGNQSLPFTNNRYNFLVFGWDYFTFPHHTSNSASASDSLPGWTCFVLLDASLHRF